MFPYSHERRTVRFQLPARNPERFRLIFRRNSAKKSHHFRCVLAALRLELVSTVWQLPSFTRGSDITASVSKFGPA
jgi:hypothetical protein